MNRLAVSNCRKLLKLSPGYEYQQIIRMLKNGKPTYMTRGHNNHNDHDHNTTLGNLRKRPNKSLDSIQPLKFEPRQEASDNVGEEICGKLNSDAINSLMISFQLSPEMKKMAQEVKISSTMFVKICSSFREYCTRTKSLSTELHIKLFDLSNNTGNISDLFPFYYSHAKEMYPHLIWMDDLKKNSDLRNPMNWFPEARSIQRKIVYHAGPTNSGKTYSALKALQDAETGIYCGPLKLLAVEVADKINKIQKKCDLITGDDKIYVNEDFTPSSHSACTVEMANLNKEFDVAVIDEIQLISDIDRGWAWTRAVLGLRAKEIHICGDSTAVDLLKEMCFDTGDSFEVKKYNRLTPLTFLEKPLGDLSYVQPGDCIVCFNKKHIFQVIQGLQSLKREFAVIYGSLPPSVKLSEAKRFNDPSSPCKILVATDAIGMGLNLNIRRMIFFNITKVITKDTQKNSTDDAASNDVIMGPISTTQALQISGRAGRYNTNFSEGFVTALGKNDLVELLNIVEQPLESLSKAGLHPMAEQVEQFSYFLPKYTMSQLLDVFVSICEIDNSKYFLCNYENIIYLASLIDHIPLRMSERYLFACTPVSKSNTFLISAFVKFVRLYSSNEPIGIEEVTRIVNWPVENARTPEQLKYLETVFDTLDLYLWLGFRFPTMFPSMDEVKSMRKTLNDIIGKGLKVITKEKSIRKTTEKTAEKINQKNTELKTENTAEKINQKNKEQTTELTTENNQFQVIKDWKNTEFDNFQNLLIDDIANKKKEILGGEKLSRLPEHAERSEIDLLDSPYVADDKNNFDPPKISKFQNRNEDEREREKRQSSYSNTTGSINKTRKRSDPKQNSKTSLDEFNSETQTQKPYSRQSSSHTSTRNTDNDIVNQLRFQASKKKINYSNLPNDDTLNFDAVSTSTTIVSKNYENSENRKPISERMKKKERKNITENVIYLFQSKFEQSLEKSIQAKKAMDESIKKADEERVESKDSGHTKSDSDVEESFVREENEKDDEKIGKDIFKLHNDGIQNDYSDHVSSLLKNITLEESERTNLINAPIPPTRQYLSSVYSKIIKKFSTSELITVNHIVEIIEWPKNDPSTIDDLINLEETYDVFRIYVWLKNKYPNVFSDDLSKVKSKMDEVKNRILANTVSIVEEDTDRYFQILSRFETEEKESLDHEEPPRSVSNELLSALSKKTAEIKRENNIQDENSENDDDDEIVKSSDENTDIGLGEILKNRDKSDPSYTTDLEIIVKELLQKKVLKEKSIKRILNEKKLTNEEDN